MIERGLQKLFFAAEKNVGNRGSKSALFYDAVKVQRVDGSWQVGGASCLRYTLMSLEINL